MSCWLHGPPKTKIVTRMEPQNVASFFFKKYFIFFHFKNDSERKISDERENKNYGKWSGSFYTFQES